MAAGSAAVSQPLAVPASAVMRRGELSAVGMWCAMAASVLQAVRTGPSSGSAPCDDLVWRQPVTVLQTDAVRAGLAGATRNTQ